MKKYEHIFFDLDETLWDFGRNSRESITELYYEFNLEKIISKSNLAEFIKVYYEVNSQLWTWHNEGKMNQLELRYTRFLLVLLKLGANPKEIPNIELAEKYLEITPRKPHLEPFAKEILEYLKDKYHLHIITNGFADVQYIKLESSKIIDYFELIVTSQNSGFSKPNKKVFDYAVNQLNTSNEKCIMIGDNLNTDILGAKNAEIDHVFYNPKNKKHQGGIGIEITSLEQLMSIL